MGGPHPRSYMGEGGRRDREGYTGCGNDAVAGEGGGEGRDSSQRGEERERLPPDSRKNNKPGLASK